jgi:hypothetical protein
MSTPVRVLVEVTPKKAFASALDWPGLSRAGRDGPGALAALTRALPRYGVVAAVAGVAFDANAALEVAEEAPGDAATAFGVPSIVAAGDRLPTTAVDGERLAALVAGCWEALLAAAAGAPAELRKGPRGGGRDRDKVVGHVTEAESAYAAKMGLRVKQADPAGLIATRAAILDLLRTPSDGAPLAGKRWPARYAARRIAWHALDHAWEIEDRAEPA